MYIARKNDSENSEKNKFVTDCFIALNKLIYDKG